MRFTIPRGKPFYCEFVIKEPGANIPMNVTGATGVFTLVEYGYNGCIALDALPMQVVDGMNGIMSINLIAEQTGGLLGDRGFKEDGYPLLPTYRAQLDIVANEPISVDIPKVYILDDGFTCQQS